MSDEKQRLHLKIVTPNGQAAALECGSVRLCIPDDAAGENGGWLGIRPGHEDALLAVAEGVLQAVTEEKNVTIRTAAGFAFVEKNTVMVMTDHAEIQ